MEERPVSEISEKKKNKFKEKIENAYDLVRGLPLLGKTVIKREGKAILKRGILIGICYAGISFVFARSPLFFGAMPLMLAFMMQISTKAVIPSFVGGLIGALLSGSAAFGQTVCLILGMGARLILRYIPGSRGLFKEPLLIRCALSMSINLVFSLYVLVGSGFAMDSLYAMLFSLVMAPLASFVFSFADNESAKPIYRDTGLCFILFFTVYGLGKTGIFGVSLGFLAAAFVTFCTAARSGSLRAFITGALCGLALGAEYVPVIGAAGLVSGILMGTSPIWAVSAASGISGILAVYIIGYESILIYSADALFASVIFLALNKAGLVPNFKFFESAELKREDSDKKERSKLADLSSALESLSADLLSISEKHKSISFKEYKEICEDALSKRCSGCKNSSVCLGILYQDTAESVNAIANALYENKVATSDDLGEDFAERCHLSEEIVLDINERAAELFEERLRRDKTDIIALDYEALSELLVFASSSAEKEHTDDHALALAASRALRSIGISAIGYSAYGTRIKTVNVSGISVGSLTMGAKEIKSALESECKILFEEPRFDFISDKVMMEISSREKISAELGFASLAREGENECGDSVRCFDGERGFSYAMICDGMGSGRNAARAAEISSVFLERMIKGGNKKDTVLKMLSNFIRSRSDECSSTADILEIDRYLGEATFIKCGAALSLVIRNDKTFKVDAKSLPVGVTKDIDPEQIKLGILPLDIIVMMSDGISDIIGIDQISECVNLNREKSAYEIAQKIIDLSNDLPNADDRSVTAIKISSVK